MQDKIMSRTIRVRAGVNQHECPYAGCRETVSVAVSITALANLKAFRRKKRIPVRCQDGHHSDIYIQA